MYKTVKEEHLEEIVRAVLDTLERSIGRAGDAVAVALAGDERGHGLFRSVASAIPMSNYAEIEKVAVAIDRVAVALNRIADALHEREGG
jgi:hypothetical protein